VQEVCATIKNFVDKGIDCFIRTLVIVGILMYALCNFVRY